MNANRYMRDSLRTADRSNMDRLKLECALGLCGEAGEVAEQVKKHFFHWRDACEGVEIRYFDMLAEGCTPQEARSVLPNSLKTEVVMTANIREWRHFLKLRCSPAAHPQMREVALILLDKVHWLIPVCFDDIWSEYHADV